jgi:tripartite-type tricarboxylate transporter receptor subunit TctC
MQPFTTTHVLYGPMIVALTLLFSGEVLGQVYPTHPIRLVVPFSAGAGVTDIMARLVGRHLSARIGQQIVMAIRS